MQIVDIGQLRELIVTQQPGIGIDLRRENQVAVEGLQDQVILPTIQTGGEANAMILRQAGQSLGGLTGDRLSPMVRSGHPIGHEHVDIGLSATQQKGGRVTGSLAQLQTVVQQDKVWGDLSHTGHHPVERIIFLRTQLATNRIHLEETETIVTHQANHHLLPLLRLLLGRAEAIGSAPQTKMDTQLRRLLTQRPEPLRELPPETIRLSGAIHLRPIHGSRIEGIDVELHPEPLLHPTEEVEVDAGMRIRRSLVRVVDP